MNKKTLCSLLLLILITFLLISTANAVGLNKTTVNKKEVMKDNIQKKEIKSIKTNSTTVSDKTKVKVKLKRISYSSDKVSIHGRITDEEGKKVQSDIRVKVKLNDKYYVNKTSHKVGVWTVSRGKISILDLNVSNLTQIKKVTLITKANRNYLSSRATTNSFAKRARIQGQSDVLRHIIATPFTTVKLNTTIVDEKNNPIKNAYGKVYYYEDGKLLGTSNVTKNAKTSYEFKLDNKSHIITKRYMHPNLRYSDASTIEVIIAENTTGYEYFYLTPNLLIPNYNTSVMSFSSINYTNVTVYFNNRKVANFTSGKENRYIPLINIKTPKKWGIYPLKFVFYYKETNKTWTMERFVNVKKYRSSEYYMIRTENGSFDYQEKYKWDYKIKRNTSLSLMFLEVNTILKYLRAFDGKYKVSFNNETIIHNVSDRSNFSFQAPNKKGYYYLTFKYSGSSHFLSYKDKILIKVI